MKPGITHEEAINMFQHVVKDMENGVNISSEARALIYFALIAVENFDIAQDEANQQAEWEFQNNPMQPGARIACEKLAKAFDLLAGRSRAELFAPTNLPGIGLSCEKS